MQDIVTNVKVTSWLKCELLESVADVFSYSQKENGKKDVQDALAASITACYLLAARMGIAFEDLGDSMQEKIRSGIAGDHICETRYCDLSKLSQHLRGENHESRFIEGCQRQRQTGGYY